MKPRTLLILFIMLVVAVGGAFLLHRPADSYRQAQITAGGLLLEGLDVNQVARLEIATSETTNRVLKTEKGWISPDLYGYPVDFQKLARELVKLSEVKAGQVIAGGVDYPEEFGLDPEGETSPGSLKLFDEQEELLAEVLIGDPRFPQGEAPAPGGYPGGGGVPGWTICQGRKRTGYPSQGNTGFVAFQRGPNG